MKTYICLKLGIDWARLPHATVLARQTRSFVYRVRVEHQSAAAAWRCPSDTRPPQLKEHSTLKSLCRGTKNRSDLARHAPSSRGNMVSTLRGEAKYIAWRGSRTQSIPGFTRMSNLTRKIFVRLKKRLEQKLYKKLNIWGRMWLHSRASFWLFVCPPCLFSALCEGLSEVSIHEFKI
jgi:hypothetical protein